MRLEKDRITHDEEVYMRKNHGIRMMIKLKCMRGFVFIIIKPELLLNRQL